MKTFCVFHKVDNDGKCSAFLVTKAFPDAVLIPYNYSDPAVTPKILEKACGEPFQVFLVDISLTFEDMFKLTQATDKVVWLDHHISAIEKLKDFEQVAGKRDITKAGCELTWEYLFPKLKMPDYVRLVGRYDVWDHKDPNVCKFSAGSYVYDTWPTKDLWKDLDWEASMSDRTFLEAVLNAGTVIERYNQQQNKILANSMIKLSYKGLSMLLVNRGGGSKLFDEHLDKHLADVLTTVVCDGKFWRVSMYKGHTQVDVDCAKLCQEFGGGGHKGAAGFFVDSSIKLPKEFQVALNMC